MKQLALILFVFIGLLPACSQDSRKIHFKGEMARKSIQLGNFYFDTNEELTEEAKKRKDEFEAYVKKQDSLPEEEQKKDMLWMDYRNLREAGLTELPLIYLVNKEGKLKTSYIPESEYEKFRTFTNEFLKSHIVNVEFEGQEIDFGEEFGSVYKLDKLIKINVSKGESKYFK